MDIRQHNQDLDDVEAIMDRCSDLGDFIDLVAEVCSAKADHRRSNWQDDAAADTYDRVCGQLLNIKFQLDGR